VLTIPFVPTAGRFAVFLLAGPSTGPASCSAAGSSFAGPAVSSPLELTGADASSEVPLSPDASLFRALD
jgi:hypothetical protein